VAVDWLRWLVEVEPLAAADEEGPAGGAATDEMVDDEEDRGGADSFSFSLERWRLSSPLIEAGLGSRLTMGGGEEQPVKGTSTGAKEGLVETAVKWLNRSLMTCCSFCDWVLLQLAAAAVAVIDEQLVVQAEAGVLCVELEPLMMVKSEQGMASECGGSVAKMGQGVLSWTWMVLSGAIRRYSDRLILTGHWLIKMAR